MAKYNSLNDTILGEKIYCVFEKKPKHPKLVSTEGRHNAQALTIEGNPAYATITKPLRCCKGQAD
jgi:hypothetical protein